VPVAKPFAVSLVLGAAWALCNAAYVMSDSEEGMLFWSSLKIVATSFLPVALLVMAIRYHKRSRWWNWWLVCLLSLVPALTSFLSVTHNPIFTGQIWLETSGALPELHFHEGQYFAVHIIYTYGIAVAALFLVIASLRDLQPLYRLQTTVIIVSMFVPMVAEGLRILNVLHLHDPAPLFFAISGAIMAWAFSRLRVLDLAPVAHSLVIKNMPDLMLVVDTKERVVDLNPAASAILKASPDHAIGRPVSLLLPEWRKLSARYAGMESARCEVAIDLDGGARVYDLSVSVIRSAGNAVAGRLLLLRDITDHYEIKEAYQQANLQLQRQLTHAVGWHAQLREQAIRDPLTGLFNRRYLEEALHYELMVAEQAGQPMSIIMLDLDYFKRVNDTWGHDTGDHVLQEISKLLLFQTLDTDIVCRLGGEEFMLILPGVSRQAAYERAEAYRVACQSLYVLEGADRVGCTVSLGVASYPADGGSAQELMRAADVALYSAKAAGRNHTAFTSTAFRLSDAETTVLPSPELMRIATTTKLAPTGPM
jgi:diguanylate cyclase (GGDEF)-like protein/PAS domain S-box-containing protein